MTKITNFVWNPVDDCIISELDGTGAVQAVYTNEPQQYGGVISQRRGTTTSTYHTDALGSTRFLTDESGTVTDTYLYDAWGNTVAETGTTTMPFKWVGKYGYYTDESTGQVYVRARMYEPTVARWASIDPKFDETNEVFAYGTNGPVSHLDPSGLLTWESSTLETGPCGMYHWPVRFIPESERQGWIVQEVSFWFDIGQCNSAVSIKSQPCSSAKNTGHSGAVAPHTYWEIWYVTRSGDIATAGRLRRSPSKNWVFDDKSAVVGGGMDYFGYTGQADTYIEQKAFTQTGKVYFLRGNIIPPEFVTQSGRPRRAANAAGGLASTCDRPRMLRGLTPVLTRSVERHWNCCCYHKDIGEIRVQISGGVQVPRPPRPKPILQ